MSEDIHPPAQGASWPPSSPPDELQCKALLSLAFDRGASGDKTVEQDISAAVDTIKRLKFENERLKAGAFDRIAVSIQEREQLKSALEKSRRTLCFFASVIKSGEAWSETCEKEFRESK